MSNVIDENLCFFYISSKLHGVDPLVPKLLNQMVLNLTIILSSHSVLRIKGSEILKDLLPSEKLDIDEMEIYKTALH
uniref:Uncharacterized protein n=1 Tax=Lepeophtheirus salmonis TaxID=72036 RepID=A0A0K2VB99_LEPSM